jgi:UDP-N-acetylmuramoylalanine--D-glutamate ligase
MGQTASMIEMALMRKVIGKYRGMNIRITHCSTLKQAVDCASLSARPGDIVLLSPASAGFELFKDFNERGNLFKDYVNEL